MSEPSIQIQAEVTRQIRRHARSSMTTEVCGVLVGELLGAENAVTIFAAIAGVNAAQAGTHVTFTQDTWEHIYKVKDATYPEARIVGWYHSHPGFGVFLSEHDTFIQENFFSAVSQVAWVFDPHTDEEGCFGWVEGAIRRLTAITVVDSGASTEVAASRELAVSKEPAEDATPEASLRRRRMRVGPPPRWLRWTASISALLAMLLLGFAVARLLFPSLYPLLLPVNPLSGQPLLRDPKTGEPVYMDPQRGRYVVADPHTGRLVPVDPAALKAAQPPAAEGNPFLPNDAPAGPVPPGSDPPASRTKEKK